MDDVKKGVDLDALKQRFIEICATINRSGMEELMGWLERSDFYTAQPALDSMAAIRAVCWNTALMSMTSCRGSCQGIPSLVSPLKR